MGWFRSGSIQEMIGLDVVYNLTEGVGDGDGDIAARMGDADNEDEAKYMDAYERYRQHMREKRKAESSDGDLDSE